MTKRFKENLNTVVFTSKYVIYENSPIVYVSHHADGIWEFWGNEKIDESEIVVVSLSQLIGIEPAILDIADLPIEFSAVRESKDKPWTIVAKN
jgi:hypothetical protein